LALRNAGQEAVEACNSTSAGSETVELLEDDEPLLCTTVADVSDPPPQADRTAAASAVIENAKD
jgi:hypothetical protein